MKKILLFFTLAMFTFTVSAQNRGMNTISTSGSSVHFDRMIISWTIGEDILDFTMLDASNVYKPEIKPGVLEMKDGTLLKVYPTVTTGKVTVEIRRTELTDLRIEILDITGRKHKVIDLESDKIELDFSGYTHGSYYLKIINWHMPDLATFFITKI
jgi:hypothetical protein